MELDGYSDFEPIGGGGYATVYKARHTQLGRDVAIKLLTQHFHGSRDSIHFQTEAHALGRLSSHPNIVDVYDAGVTSAQRGFIVMRLYNRGTIADQVRQTGPQNVQYVVAVGRQLASALQQAHARGIIHRDVKPENVLLDEESRPILTDFGISVMVDLDGPTTAPAAFSMSHAAPEVLDRNEFSAASDQYSLASSLYAMLSGMPAFNENTATRQIAAVVANPVPPLDRNDVPPEVEYAITRAMAKDPADRFPSVADFAAALDPATSGNGPMDPDRTSVRIPTGAEVDQGLPSADTLHRPTPVQPPPRWQHQGPRAAAAITSPEASRRNPAALVVAAIIGAAVVTAGIGIALMSKSSDAVAAASATPTVTATVTRTARPKAAELGNQQSAETPTAAPFTDVEAPPGLSGDSPSVDGHWVGKMASDVTGAHYKLTMTLTEDGGALSGTATVTNTSTGKTAQWRLEGHRDGDTLWLNPTIWIRQPNADWTMDYFNLAVRGSALTGTFAVENAPETRRGTVNVTRR